MTPRDFVDQTLMAHEGGLSMDKTDAGNWFNGQLIGSKYGVTGAALAAYRHTPTITAEQMATLTKTEAIDIALSLYYKKPRFDLLVWNQVTASIVDMGYNAGPVMSSKLLQRTIVVADDGQVGPHTVSAYAQWLHDIGLEHAAAIWSQVRIDHYEDIIEKRPANAKYRNGWINRAKSFLPGTDWWRAF